MTQTAEEVAADGVTGTSSGEADASTTPQAGSGLVRVTVTGRDRRADLVLPGALPVAELLPELCRTVGMLDPQTAHAGYELRHQDGRALAPDVGLVVQGVEDGSVITVSAGVDQVAPRVYDDIVEAMADAVEADQKPWDPASSRRTALGSGALLLGLGALSLGLQRPDPVAGAAAGVAAVVLAAAAVVLSRVREEHAAAVVLAWAGVVFAAVAGLTAAPAGPLLALPAALAGAGALLAGLVGLTGLEQRRAALLPAVAVGTAVAGCSAIVAVTDLRAPAVYLVALVLTVLAGSVLPWASIASTGTRVDQAQNHADLTAEPRPIDPDEVRSDARIGHEVLLGVTVTVGLTLVLVAPMAVGLGVTGAVLVVLASAVLMLRTRQYRAGSEVAAGLVSGVAGLVSAAVGVLVLQPDWRVALAVLLGVAAAALLVLTLVPLSPSVRRGRLGDVAELVALVATLPLLVLAIDLVGAVRS